MKAAIYHFTDESSIRPAVCQKEIDRLIAFAKSKGYEDIEVFLDKTLVKKNQSRLAELKQSISDYDAIITKDFYHIKKNTGAFISDLQCFRRAGVELLSIEDGRFINSPASFDKTKNVAIYFSGLELVERTQELQCEIMKYFIKTHSSWIVIDIYADNEGNKTDSNQTELHKLISNRDKYDLVFVRNFNEINWRTAKFCKLRHELKKDIYSMQDDFYLAYGKETI